jgi:hypothetical protein
MKLTDITFNEHNLFVWTMFEVSFVSLESCDQHFDLALFSLRFEGCEFFLF